MWPTPPGALHVRPLPRESAASYLTRLAAAYHLSPAHLLDGLHITTTGSVAVPPATEIHLSNEATRRLSHFTRIPPAHLARALPRRPPPAAIGTAGTATARCSPPRPRCSRCLHAPPAPSAAAPTKPSPHGSTRHPTCPES
ncbi:TniQ family protein [Streptomyces sp. NPDC007172]|uniref:TniQ family protein n=1 Tax=Streptomyces sp. NPDC007172 TaxID=3364776 RepID=UPI0036BA502A